MNFTPLVNSFLNTLLFVMCINAQSCPTLCNTVDCSPPGSSVGEFPGKNTEVGSHSLLQGIFPTQGLNCGVGGDPAFSVTPFLTLYGDSVRSPHTACTHVAWPGCNWTIVEVGVQPSNGDLDLDTPEGAYRRLLFYFSCIRLCFHLENSSSCSLIMCPLLKI